MAETTAPACKVEGCDEPVKRPRTGYCYGHYMKSWRYGTPTPQHPPTYDSSLVGLRVGSLTVTAERVGTQWVCECDCGGTTLAGTTHLKRGQRKACGNTAAHRRLSSVAYCTAHDRCRSDRGKASDHTCVDCGKQAHDWSYNHDDPNECVDEGTGAPYSTDPGHYSPRCMRCHRIFDGHPFMLPGGEERRAWLGR